MTSVENKLLRKIFRSGKDTASGTGRYYKWRIP
jgi:hypothetical protein